ncbi:MAG: cupin domain-containing protein [Vicinamibacteria bacterium]|nr:cupin domain-containing protein [Vicinamibacteria bacterium]
MSRIYRNQTGIYSIGALEAEEKARFEEHIRDCADCRDAVRACHEALAYMTPHHAPRPQAWDRIRDFIEIPKKPVDMASYPWQEVGGGVRLSVFREDVQRGVRTLLMWVPSASLRASHHHFADEEILVLSGMLRVGEQTCSTGEMCRVQAGREHVEEAVRGEDCLYVVVHRTSERPVVPRGTLDAMCRNCDFRTIHEAAFKRRAV